MKLITFRDLGVSWQELKSQTERAAHFHENAGSEYSRLADEIAKFTEDLKQICKPVSRNCTYVNILLTLVVQRVFFMFIFK